MKQRNGSSNIGVIPEGPVPALLDWETVHHKMPWNVIIVLGGGFALADACKVCLFIFNSINALCYCTPGYRIHIMNTLGRSVSLCRSAAQTSN